MRQDESEAAITPSSAVSRLHVAFLLGPRTARWDEVNSVVELLSLRAPTVGDLPPPKTQRWVARRKDWINGRNIPVDGLEQPHAPLDRRPY